MRLVTPALLLMLALGAGACNDSDGGGTPTDLEEVLGLLPSEQTVSEMLAVPVSEHSTTTRTRAGVLAEELPARVTMGIVGEAIRFFEQPAGSVLVGVAILVYDSPKLSQAAMDPLIDSLTTRGDCEVSELEVSTIELGKRGASVSAFVDCGFDSFWFRNTLVLAGPWIMNVALVDRAGAIEPDRAQAVAGKLTAALSDALGEQED